MHYSKENTRGANSCVLIHVIEKGGVRGWEITVGEKDSQRV